MEQWSVPVWAVVVAVALVLLVNAALVVALLRVRARAADAQQLQARLDDIERRLAETRDSTVETSGLDGLETGVQREAEEYVITQVGEAEAEPAATVPAPLFADLVLRESVVQVVSYAAGLRRALSAENRNRIRFEMKREVKRARKQRKADLKEARREWEARQRQQVDLDEPAGDAA